MNDYRLPLLLITRGKWRQMTKTSAKSVLVAIGFCANWHTGICWPGIKLIQEITGIKKRKTVIDATNSLISLDLIEKGKKGHDHQSGPKVTKEVERPDRRIVGVVHSKAVENKAGEEEGAKNVSQLLTAQSSGEPTEDHYGQESDQHVQHLCQHLGLSRRQLQGEQTESRKGA